jgi:glucose/mannose transport system substrate-binding protein
MRKLTLTMTAAAFVGSAGLAAADDVEVLHWWTSGGEAAALNVLREDLAGQGIGWQDMPVAGGGGTQAMTVLRARVTAGNAPTAVQMLGFDILDWAAEGALANLNEIAAADNWDEVVPEALQFWKNSASVNRAAGTSSSQPCRRHRTQAMWRWPMAVRPGKKPPSSTLS